MIRDIDKIENVAALGLLLGAAGGSNEEAAAASAQAAAASAESASASAEEAATKLDEINETVDNIPSDYQELIDDVSGLKADLNVITTTKYEQYTSAVKGGGDTYWLINTASQQLAKDTKYKFVIMPNETFNLDDIKAGTSASAAGMVDVVAENVSFVAGEPYEVDYTPSQTGIRYFRFLSSSSKITSVTFETISKEVNGSFVRYDRATSLTDIEKAQARANINAASTEDVQAVNDEFNSALYVENDVFVNYATKGDANYYVLSANGGSLSADKQYKFVIMPNETFNLDDIKAGTSASAARMVDVVAENVSFVAGEPYEVDYTPSQTGIRYFRFYDSSAKITSVWIYEVSSVEKGFTEDYTDKGLYSLANRINRDTETLRRLQDDVDTAVTSMLKLTNTTPTEKTITLPSVGERDRVFVRIGMHYGQSVFTPKDSDVFFDGNCNTDFSDVRFFDANGNILKAQFSKPVNLDLLCDDKLDGFLKHLSDGTLIKYLESSGIMLSLDSGATWTAISGTANVTQNASAVYARKSMYPVFVDSNDNIFAYAGGKLYKLTAASSYNTIVEVLDFSWDNDGITIYPDIQDHAMVEDGNGNLVVGACYQEQYHVNVYRSTDGGDTFTLAWYHYGGTEYQHVHFVSVDPDTDKIYVCIDDGGYTWQGTRIITSTDGGTTWAEITTENNHQVRGRDYYPSYFGDGYRLGGGETYIMGKATIYRSEDDVNYECPVLGVAGVRSFADFGDDSLIIAGSQDSVVAHENHVFLSTDQGRTWDSIAKYYQPISSYSGVGWRRIHSAFTPYGESEACVIMPKDGGNVPTLRIYKGGSHYYREAYVLLENTANENIVITAKTGYAMEYPYKVLQGKEHAGLLYSIPLNEGAGRYVHDSAGNIAKIVGGFSWEQDQEPVHYGDYEGKSTLYPHKPSSALMLDAGAYLNFGKISELNMRNGYTITFWINPKERLMDKDNFDNYKNRPYSMFQCGDVTFIQRNTDFGYVQSDAFNSVLTDKFALMTTQRPSHLYSNQYFYVCIVVESNNKVTVYLNGEKGQTQTHSGVTSSTRALLSDGDMIVGNAFYGSGSYLSDIKIYGRVIDDAEILELYRGW